MAKGGEIIMTTTDNQPTANAIATALSSDESAALEAIANGGFASSIIGNVIDKVFHLVRHRLVHELKLMDSDDDHDWLTTLGESVLATRASAPVAEKPATISAREFVNGDIVELVTQDGVLLPIGTQGYITEADNTMAHVLFPLYDKRWVLTDNLKFISHRFERYSGGTIAAPQVANETAEGRAEDDKRSEVEILIRANKRFDGIRLVHNKYGESIIDARDYVNKVAGELSLMQSVDVSKMTLDTMQAKIASLQAKLAASEAELSALRDQNVRLRELAGRAADKLQWAMLAGYPESEVS